jgi:hypothetical protein
MTTNDTARAFATAALEAHKHVADAMVAQTRLAEKNVATALDATRAGLELQRDLAQSMGKTVLDAVAPAAPAPKA